MWITFYTDSNVKWNELLKIKNAYIAIAKVNQWTGPLSLPQVTKNEDQKNITTSQHNTDEHTPFFY